MMVCGTRKGEENDGILNKERGGEGWYVEQGKGR